ncbi:hypothetical protein AAP_02528 [Ascosphaera apis ARSEF 7405]|uniref:Uncharacterized protein n=1 Tax=Ascosphaera apis ARSEF 7405 TaxID=392613 RepID=A0A167ZT53_9EURO|nr:hypothetical protein AAP_02528 [Ascosphaera apis ARSEF 7405]
MSTTYLNVYRVTFIQIDDPKHVAIAVVPERSPHQGTGELIHLAGYPPVFERKRTFDFACKRTFKDARFQYKIPVAMYELFLATAQGNQLPLDPRDLAADDQPFGRSNVDWVDEVIERGRRLAG